MFAELLETSIALTAVGDTMVRKVAPFGTWDSPISSEYVAKSAVSFDDVLVDPIPSRSHPNGNGIYYIEKRPAEAGRNVLVDASTKKDVFGKGWNARSVVHEYGGASAVVHGGTVYFTNFGDMRMYKIDLNSDDAEPTPVTRENKVQRFANFAVHPTVPHLLVAILEDHTFPAPSDVQTCLVTINTHAGTVSTLVYGSDFFAAPIFNPDGTRLAWIQWDHPDMPWDGAQVYVAEVINQDDKLELKDIRKIKGTPSRESAVRPHWFGPDSLFFFSDESGFQNPWYVDLGDHSAVPRPALLPPVKEDFAEPDWQLGYSSSALLGDFSALCVTTRDGRSVLYLLGLNTGALKEISTPYVVIKNIRRTGPRSAVFIGIKSDEPMAVVHISLDESSDVKLTTLVGGDPKSVQSDSEKIDKAFFAEPRPLTLKGREGFPLYAIFYSPTNPDFKGPDGEKPPCIINAHGGPTGMADQGFSLRKQFFTSRGFAWVDVNYGGSSGYGRKYIERLDGNWGIIDVSDCVDAAHSLASLEFGEIDPARVAITGGSAGGYTVLQSLCTGRSGVFAAGASSYGISNLFTLVEDTHKFESRYMEKLLGGTAKEIPHVLRSRSPVFHADRIKAPLLILQGTDDKVVPPSQAEEMLKVIREHGGRVEYVLFEGEGHGWRKAENIVAALEKELEFYLDVLGLKK